MLNHTGLYILLAAGFSRRFGRPKLLQPLPYGNLIIDESITALRASGSDFIVVIREDDKDLFERVASLDAEVIQVSNAQQGLSSVIAECISRLDIHGLEWLGICLGDMPYIAPTTFQMLSEHASPRTIVRPRHKGKSGHPVLFGKTFFPSLSQLEGDDGAKSIINAHRHAYQEIEVGDPMILHDIDTPEDMI